LATATKSPPATPKAASAQNAPIATQPRSTQKPKTAPAPAAGRPDERLLSVSLAALAGRWPQAVRAEIEEWEITGSDCQLPLADIRPALKAGKVQFTWKKICSHLNPPLSKKASAADDTILDLPLSVLAPAYIELCGEDRSGKKLSVAKDIPDVFNQNPKTPVIPAKVAAVAQADRPPEPSPTPVRPSPAESAGSIAAEAVAPAAASEPATRPNRPAFLTLPLTLVSQNWPDQVRKEIDMFNLTDSKLEVPFASIEEGLKQGRLQFRWRQVCLWLRPPPPPAMASATLATQLDYRVDLPLNFVAPLYLQHHAAPAQAAKRSAAFSEIPDVFSHAPAVVTPVEQKEVAPTIPSPTPAPAPAPAPARTAVAKGPRKAGEELAEIFGEPEKRNWTPNDIVHKTATLPGVAGALIALQDGLLVASCMPPHWKTETIAAFLPQIFGRMNQYTAELKMGELCSVTFSVDQGTLQIFNAGIIYFAALSHLDQPLPLAELNLIAKEIGRHTK
jgi:predicted regulator of Ras-like GTPase activity (Roadblock/LC7/MglB family)